MFNYFSIQIAAGEAQKKLHLGAQITTALFVKRQ